MPLQQLEQQTAIEMAASVSTRPFLRRIASSASDFSERERAWARQLQQQLQQAQRLAPSMEADGDFHGGQKAESLPCDDGEQQDSASHALAERYKDAAQNGAATTGRSIKNKYDASTRIKAFKELLRPGFHHNYSIVLIGAFEFGNFSIASAPQVLQVQKSLPFETFLVETWHALLRSYTESVYSDAPVACRCCGS